MNLKPIKVLLIEDNPADTDFIREMLSEIKRHPFNLEHAERLSSGLEHLAKGDTEVVLLDLTLPDSQGLGTLARVHAQAPEVPVVVLTGLDDEMPAIKAMLAGAQDYLIKGQVDSGLLLRSLRYAIKRNQVRRELHTVSLADELTGLCNRRGFFNLVQQQLKMADREEREILLIFVDLDGLKQINDTLGHQVGDLALIETANVLNKTFRESDIIARIGGDEFVIIATEVFEGEVCRDDSELLTTRLQKNLENHNRQGNRSYKLSLSVGVACYDPEYPCSIDELLAQADKLMYQQKRDKAVVES